MLCTVSGRSFVETSHDCLMCSLRFKILYKQNTIDNPTFANKVAEVSYLAVWHRHVRKNAWSFFQTIRCYTRDREPSISMFHWLRLKYVHLFVNPIAKCPSSSPALPNLWLLLVINGLMVQFGRTLGVSRAHRRSEDTRLLYNQCGLFMGSSST